jgi:ribosomal-protein-alanine N-acetyltransferase
MIDPETIKYRPLTQADLTAVMQIEDAVYPHGWTIGIFQDCLRVGYNCFAIELNKHLVGYMILSVAVGEAHILNIAIDPLYQKQGIGTLAMQQLMDISLAKGAEAAFLEVRPSNKYAIQLYEGMGFSQVGLRKDYYPTEKGREDAIIMAIPLNFDIPF